MPLIVAESAARCNLIIILHGESNCEVFQNPTEIDVRKAIIDTLHALVAETDELTRAAKEGDLDKKAWKAWTPIIFSNLYLCLGGGWRLGIEETNVTTG
jgi:hypothetical protein